MPGTSRCARTWRRWCLLLALAALPALACEPPAPSRPLPDASAQQWLLATQNLWRLRDTARDSRHDQPVSAGHLSARLQAQADYIRSHLRSPHLLAVQEVENRALLVRLAQRIHAAGGPEYRVFLAEGNDPSGIDVGALVRAPVTVSRVDSLFRNQRFNGGPLFSRPPLLLELDAPLPWSVLVVHLRSGRGLDDPARSRWVTQKRARQAQALVDWIRGQHRPVLLMGDFNSAPQAGIFSEPLQHLLATPLQSAWQQLPSPERYSYVYRCQPQAIDHVLYGVDISTWVERVAVSRGNAGRYRSLRDSDGISPVSDHEAVAIYVRMPPSEKEREQAKD